MWRETGGIGETREMSGNMVPHFPTKDKGDCRWMDAKSFGYGALENSVCLELANHGDIIWCQLGITV